MHRSIAALEEDGVVQVIAPGRTDGARGWHDAVGLVLDHQKAALIIQRDLPQNVGGGKTCQASSREGVDFALNPKKKLLAASRKSRRAAIAGVAAVGHGEEPR